MEPRAKNPILLFPGAHDAFMALNKSLGTGDVSTTTLELVLELKVVISGSGRSSSRTRSCVRYRRSAGTSARSPPHACSDHCRSVRWNLRRSRASRASPHRLGLADLDRGSRDLCIRMRRIPAHTRLAIHPQDLRRSLTRRSSERAARLVTRPEPVSYRTYLA
jgi:hypothetical protein